MKLAVFKHKNGDMNTILSTSIKKIQSFDAPKGWYISHISIFPSILSMETEEEIDIYLNIYLSKVRT